MSSVPKRLKKLGRFVRSQIYLQNEFLPRFIYDDDIFIVSYPRSGNTWVRFLVANLIGPPGVEVNFQTINQIVPPIASLPHLKWKLPRPRFIKSHALYQPRYPKVIYIMRDGRDAYLSYFHYLQKKRGTTITLREFLEKEAFWPSTWEAHIHSWLEAGLDERRLLPVRFEDLQADCCRELARIASFASLDVSQEEIETAVHKSTFSQMKEIEAATSSSGRLEKTGGAFIRQGHSGQWHSYFGVAEKMVLKPTITPALVRLGYAAGENW